MEDEMDEMRATLERKDEEIRLEKQNRAILETELEAALGRSNEQVSPWIKMMSALENS